MGFFNTFRDGLKYMEIFPLEPVLNPVFPEFRVKRVMKMGKILLPPFIALIVLWSYVRGGGLQGVEMMFALKSNWPVTICCVLLLLLMPGQGYWWFGKRARLPLNPRLRIFYIETCIQLQRSGVDAPDLMELMTVINEGIKVLGRDFLRKL